MEILVNMWPVWRVLISVNKRFSIYGLEGAVHILGNSHGRLGAALSALAVDHVQHVVAATTVLLDAQVGRRRLCAALDAVDLAAAL